MVQTPSDCWYTNTAPWSSLSPTFCCCAPTIAMLPWIATATPNSGVKPRAGLGDFLGLAPLVGAERAIDRIAQRGRNSGRGKRGFFCSCGV